MSRLSLEEHLDERPKRRIVAGLEALLATSLAARFRAQERRVRSALQKVLDDHEPDHDQPAAAPLAVSTAIVAAFAGFSYRATDRAFTRSADDVRSGAAELAAAQLDLSEDLTIPAYERNALALTTEIDLTTSMAVLEATEQAYATGTVASLLSRVEDIFQSAVDSRADSIASTEISAAYNDGVQSLAAEAKSSGLTVEKSWNAEPDACEICQGNADDGWIDDDEPFSSDDDYPPAHPNCRCTVDLRTA